MKKTQLSWIAFALFMCQGSPLLAAEASSPIAKIGSTVLTEDELRKDMGTQLYEAENQLYMIRKGWVDQKSKTFLIAQAAKKAGLSVQEWTKREIDSKVSAPSLQEIDQLASRFGVQGSTIPPTDAEYAAQKEKARQYIQGQKRMMKEAEVVQQLTAKGGTVELFFTKPEAPKIDVTYSAEDPMKGPKSAPVTIIEFTDFECPFCKRSQDTLKQVMDVYGSKVKLIEKQYPLPFHQRAKPAAEAVLCAQEQGKFWEMHDKIFPSDSMQDSDFTRFAGEIGLNKSKFEKCYSSHKMAARIEKDIADGQRVGVRGTPHFFVNGQVINGAQPFESFKTIIDAELAKK